MVVLTEFYNTKEHTRSIREIGTFVASARRLVQAKLIWIWKDMSDEASFSMKPLERSFQTPSSETCVDSTPRLRKEQAQLVIAKLESAISAHPRIRLPLQHRSLRTTYTSNKCFQRKASQSTGDVERETACQMENNSWQAKRTFKVVLKCKVVQCSSIIVLHTINCK